MRRLARIFGALVVVGALALADAARTADHRDAPGVNEDPRADINDIYAFVNPNDGNVVLAMTVNPFQIGGAPGIAFGQDVLYEFKIDNTGDNLEDLVVQMTFGPVLSSSTPHLNGLQPPNGPSAPSARRRPRTNKPGTLSL